MSTGSTLGSLSRHLVRRHTGGSDRSNHEVAPLRPAPGNAYRSPSTRGARESAFAEPAKGPEFGRPNSGKVRLGLFDPASTGCLANPSVPHPLRDALPLIHHDSCQPTPAFRIEVPASQTGASIRPSSRHRSTGPRNADPYRGWRSSGVIARGGPALLTCRSEVLALQIQRQGDHAASTDQHQREDGPNHGLTWFVADMRG